MTNIFEVRETNKMIEENNLDVRTITMGISLLDCCSDNVDQTCTNIYNKIKRLQIDISCNLVYNHDEFINISEAEVPYEKYHPFQFMEYHLIQTGEIHP